MNRLREAFRPKNDTPMRKNAWFWIILAVKLVAAATFSSHYIKDLFLPFIGHFLQSGFANPWDAFAAQGRLDAFPYSGVMLALLSLPEALARLVAPGWVDSSEHLRLFLIRLPMLGADLVIFRTLCKWFPSKRIKVLLIHWCSPILFYISYVHGQIDAIPTAFLILAIGAAFRGRALRSGIMLGVGMAAKMHLLVALPFLGLFFLRYPDSPDRVAKALKFLAGAAAAVTLLIVPLLPSEGYRLMVLGTRETGRLFEMAIPVEGNLKLYVGLMAAFIILLRFVEMHKVNRDLLILFVALVYSALVFFVPPMPGWYYWSIPLVCYFFIHQEAITSASFWLLNVLYVAYYTLFWQTSQALPAHGPGEAVSLFDPSRRESIAFTCLQAAFAIVIFWIYRVGIRSSRVYLSRKGPILVGISGDSGSGKHTLAKVLRNLVGMANSLQTNGDDYHRWERGDEAWNETTHLNPQANFMLLPVEHAAMLSEGQPVKKPIYDHDTGKFTDPSTFKPRKYVLFVGLHTLYIRRMRALLDIKIYLDPDEGLRRDWKVRRDMEKRGYSKEKVLEQIARREEDSEKHVRPQKAFADWVVSYLPQTDGSTTEGGDGPRIFTRHTLRNDAPVEALVAALRAVSGLEVEWGMDSDLERQFLIVKGAIKAAEVKAAAAALFPNLHEYIGGDGAEWMDGNYGISQLVFLVLLDVLSRDVSVRNAA